MAEPWAVRAHVDIEHVGSVPLQAKHTEADKKGSDCINPGPGPPPKSPPRCECYFPVVLGVLTLGTYLGADLGGGLGLGVMQSLRGRRGADNSLATS